jgi:hypothetical protein
MGLMDSFAGITSLFSGSGPKTSDGKYQDALHYLLKYDVGRTAYFDVTIPSKGTEINNHIKFYCHSAELPGESTATVNQKIYGVNEKFAVMTGYNDVTLSFYTHGAGVEKTRSVFFDWISSTTGRNSLMKGSGAKQNSDVTYNVQYKKDYVRDIVITQYTIDGKPFVQVKLFDAFPIGINQVPLAWSAQNQAQSLNVTFAYTEYQYEFFEVQESGNYSASPLMELVGTAIQTASTINTIKGAFKSGNPLAATSVLSNFNVSSPAPYKRG